MELIRHMGNCGSTDKLIKIMEAIEAAIKHDVMLVIVQDELCYGKNHTLFNPEDLKDYKFNRTSLFIGDNEFPWWDITKVNLLF